jgi:hypothetical protein
VGKGIEQSAEARERLRAKLANNPDYAWMSSMMEMERSMDSLKIDVDAAHEMLNDAFDRINKEGNPSEKDKSTYQDQIFDMHGDMKLEWNKGRRLVAEMGFDAASINMAGGEMLRCVHTV